MGHISDRAENTTSLSSELSDLSARRIHVLVVPLSGACVVNYTESTRRMRYTNYHMDNEVEAPTCISDFDARYVTRGDINYSCKSQCDYTINYKYNVTRRVVRNIKKERNPNRKQNPTAARARGGGPPPRTSHHARHRAAPTWRGGSARRVPCAAHGAAFPSPPRRPPRAKRRRAGNANTILYSCIYTHRDCLLVLPQRSPVGVRILAAAICASCRGCRRGHALNASAL